MQAPSIIHLELSLPTDLEAESSTALRGDTLSLIVMLGSNQDWAMNEAVL